VKFAFALAALSFALATACRAGENPYVPLPADATAVDKLVRASEFGDPNADPALETWLKANPAAPASERRNAYRRLCSDYGVHSQTDLAIKACTSAVALQPELAPDLALVKGLKGAGPLTTSGSARAPLNWNPEGSQSADITVGGVTSAWIVDTGAQISVVNASTAKAMGVKMAKGDFTIGTSTADVQGGVGLIETMKIGAATVHNVPVLVLPDAQLAVGGFPTIPGILGLPVMTAFKRIGWVDGGATLVLGEAAPMVPADAPKLYWHPEGVGLSLKTPQGEQGAHLDRRRRRADRAPGTAFSRARLRHGRRADPAQGRAGQSRQRRGCRPGGHGRGDPAG
jgi:predicted aspartyl protease